MAGAPVWAALEWRRARVWGSGMFLFFSGFVRDCLVWEGTFTFLPVWAEQHCVGGYQGFDGGGGYVGGCEEG